MSSRLQIDMRNLSLWKRNLVNAYEVEAGIGVIAGNTVIHAWAPWVWGTTKSTLYKYTYLYLYPVIPTPRPPPVTGISLAVTLQAWK